MLWKRFPLFFAIVVAFSAVACSTNVSEETVEQTGISEATETKTALPGSTVTKAIEMAESTSTTGSTTATNAIEIAKPTTIAEPTAVATPSPVATDEPVLPSLDLTLADDLDGYIELQRALLHHEDGKNYLAYIMRGEEINANDLGFSSSREVCRVAFFRWQDEQATYLGSIPAPFYPNSANEVYPFDCVLIDWEQSFWIDPFLAYAPLWPTTQSEDSKEILNLHSVESDINNNGLPEFAVAYQYCNNACWNWGIIATHFYEIQPNDTVVDITIDLPGAVVPFFNLIHDDHPGTLYVYDRGYVGPGSTVDSYWIFSWQDGKYEDTTTQFADDILAWGNDWLSKIQLEYGKSLEWLPYDFSRVLQQYEKAGLQDEAIAILSEISNYENWPGSDIYNLCYLRLIYENAVLDHQNNISFSLPPNVVGFGSAGLPAECEDLEETE